MRVLMVGPDLEAQGGIATLARTFLEAQALDGVEVEYVASVGEGSKLRKLGQMAKGEATFLRKLRSFDPDLVHIHVADGASFWRKQVYFEQAKLAGKPVALHNNFAHLEDLVEKSAAHAAVVRRAYSSADQVHVVSNDMARCISEWTDGQATVRVLFNPVPADDFPWAGPRGESAEPVVLFMGRVGERKGIFDLVEALPAVFEACPTARVRVGGDGDLDQLRARLDAKGLDRVEVLGWVSGPDRMQAYATADLYCLPSYAEGLPVSVLEAMASGLAVVSTTVDGIPDAVVEGETGFLIEPGDVAALSDRLTRLLSDAALRDRMGTASRQRVERVFDGEILAATLRRYWEEMLA